MYFLTKSELKDWEDAAGQILGEKTLPEKYSYAFHPDFKPYFSFFIGSRFAAAGNEKVGMDWARSGILHEETGLFSNAFLLNFLERNNGKLSMPDTVFADPRPYIHFTTIPSVKDARMNFALHCAQSMPEIRKLLKIMDIGCGDGGMPLMFLETLIKAGKIKAVCPSFTVRNWPCPYTSHTEE